MANDHNERKDQKKKSAQPRNRMAPATRRDREFADADGPYQLRLKGPEAGSADAGKAKIGGVHLPIAGHARSFRTDQVAQFASKEEMEAALNAHMPPGYAFEKASGAGKAGQPSQPSEQTSEHAQSTEPTDLPASSSSGTE